MDVETNLMLTMWSFIPLLVVIEFEMDVETNTILTMWLFIQLLAGNE